MKVFLEDYKFDESYRELPDKVKKYCKQDIDEGDYFHEVFQFKFRIYAYRIPVSMISYLNSNGYSSNSLSFIRWIHDELFPEERNVTHIFTTNKGHIYADKKFNEIVGFSSNSQFFIQRKFEELADYEMDMYFNSSIEFIAPNIDARLYKIMSEWINKMVSYNRSTIKSLLPNYSFTNSIEDIKELIKTYKRIKYRI